MGNSSDAIEKLANAILEAFISPNCSELYSVSHAITPRDASPGNDEQGGVVGSVTEAGMSIASALFAVSRSLDEIADAIRDSS